MLTDPSGWSPDEEGVRYDMYTYSCNCGWIDWAHATPATTAAKVIDRVAEAISELEKSDDCDYFRLDGLSHTARGAGNNIITTHTPFLIRKGKATQKNQLQVALGIYMHIMENTERFQSQPWYEIAHGIHEGFNFRSITGYSEEDLPSNLIAFYGAVNGFGDLYGDISAQSSIRFEQYKRWVCGICGCPTTGKADRVRSSLAVFAGYGPFESVTQWGTFRKHSIPEIEKQCANCGARAWPAEFSTLQALEGGQASNLILPGIPSTIVVSKGSEDRAWLILSEEYVSPIAP